MADAPRGGAAAGGARGGFGSRGDRGGDRGRGRGRRGPRRGANKNEEKEWQPVTKLGRLVKAGKIKSMEEIYLHSLPIKEYQIVDWFLPKLKDEVMKVGSGVCYKDLSVPVEGGHNRTSWLGMIGLIAVLYDRSSQSRSKPVPVNVPDSRLSWLSEIQKDTLDLVSRPQKKLPLLSVPPSSSPSSAYYQSAVVIGVQLLVNHTHCRRKRVENVDPSLLGYALTFWR